MRIDLIETQRQSVCVRERERERFFIQNFSIDVCDSVIDSIRFQRERERKREKKNVNTYRSYRERERERER